MRRSFAILLTGGLLLLSSLSFASGVAAATIAPTTTCNNGVFAVLAGKGLICEVTVVNTITASGGSARVTVRECNGAAGDPTAACTTKTTVLTKPVTKVEQCNDAINGGGGTLRCSVKVTNNFVGLSAGATAATVNQCVGSAGGGGITIKCDPFPATTSGATITQCNGSANGGGLVAGSTCTATGTKSSALGVTINQCNGSANGGGALVICSANITNRGVSSFSPSKGSAGTSVTITGSGFTGATAVKFHGRNAHSFTVISATKIRAVVAAGTTSGTISVTGPGGTGSSARTFVVTTAGSTGGSGGSSSGSTAPPTDTLTTTDVPGSGPTPVVLAGIVLVGIFLLAFVVIVSRLRGHPLARKT